VALCHPLSLLDNGKNVAPHRSINPCTGARGATPHRTSGCGFPPGHRSPPGARGSGGKGSLPAGCRRQPVTL